MVGEFFFVVGTGVIVLTVAGLAIGVAYAGYKLGRWARDGSDLS